MMDLSPIMKIRIKSWHHKVDEKLLHECAYYPRGGCQDCHWMAPNPSCSYSHILIDTRIDTRGVNYGDRKRRTNPNNLANLLNKLPQNLKSQIEGIIKKYQV